MADRQSVYLEKGKRYYGFMPHSEVCMHMRVAGKCMMFELVGDQHPMVQLYKPDGTPFSFPITTGEGGVYTDQRGHYYHPPLTYGTEVDEAQFGATLQLLETRDDNDYYPALVATALQAGWTFERLPQVGVAVKMTLPVHGSQVRVGQMIYEFMANCLDPDGEIAHLFLN